MASVVQEIGKLNFEGNIIPSSWFDHIKLESGKADMVAIVLLSEIVFFYRPVEERDETTGKSTFRKKFAADKWQISYQALADKFGLTKRQVADALKRLRDAGLITIELRTVETKAGVKLPNITYVEPVPDAIKAITFPKHGAYHPTLERNISYVQTEDILRSNVRYPTLERKTSYVQTEDITEISTEISTETSTENINNTCASNDARTCNPKEEPRNPFKNLTQQKRFDSFWAAYPKKRSKGQAERAWMKICPDEALFKEIMSGLKKAKISHDWVKDGGQFIPYPATWLNAKGWEDEHVPASKDEPRKRTNRRDMPFEEYMADVCGEGWEDSVKLPWLKPKSGGDTA